MIIHYDRIRDSLLERPFDTNLCAEEFRTGQQFQTAKFLHVWNKEKPAASDVNVASSLQSNFIANAAKKCGFALSAAGDKKNE